jgi:hypothetical protein
VGFITCKLSKGYYFTLLGELHGVEDQGGNYLHGIYVTSPNKRVLIEEGVQKLNVNQEFFPSKFNGNIGKEPLWLEREIVQRCVGLWLVGTTLENLASSKPKKNLCRWKQLHLCAPMNN